MRGSLVLIALAYSAIACAGDLPPGFARLGEVAPSVRQDMRYAGSDNFVGRPIAGYRIADCWLRRDVAEALAKVADDLSAFGWRLVVHDCYRPQRAVRDFAAWAEDPSDQAQKPEHYPAVDKRDLFKLGYIARASSHSKGVAVDVDADGPNGGPLDFGTAFDTFDPRSATANASISPEARANRKRLVDAFAARGFQNLATEWWHFSFGKAAGARAWDVEIAP